MDSGNVLSVVNGPLVRAMLIQTMVYTFQLIRIPANGRRGWRVAGAFARECT